MGCGEGYQVGISFDRVNHDKLMSEVSKRIQQGEKCTLLIIDEAHLIAPETLTDLRLLLSSIEEEISLKIILCGQYPLGQTLK